MPARNLANKLGTILAGGWHGYAKTVMGTKPTCYWPLDEVQGTLLKCLTGSKYNGTYTELNLVKGVEVGIDNKNAVRIARDGYCDIYSAALNTAFSRTEGSLQVWFRVNNTGAMYDGQTGTMMRIAQDNSNYVSVIKTGTAERLRTEFRGGGTVSGRDLNAFTDTGWNVMHITWSAANNEVITYLNGVASAALVHRTWASAALDSTMCVVGSYNKTAISWFWGWVQQAAIWNRPLTQGEVTKLASPAIKPTRPALDGSNVLHSIDESWRTIDPAEKAFELLEEPTIVNPIVTESIVPATLLPTGSAKSFVADPFVVKNGSTYYLFYEIKFTNAETSRSEQWIVYSTSTDCKSWSDAQKVVLKTEDTGSYGISFPQVIKVENTWYMVTDLYRRYLDIYRATDFPGEWELVEGLVKKEFGYTIGDSAVFQHGGYWWVTTGQLDATYNQRLFYAQTLIGGVWSEHPDSPILSAQSNYRSAGRPIVWGDGTIDIYLQDCVIKYGNKTRVFRISSLDTVACVLAETAQSPILDAAGGAVWNSDGMHHLDRINSSLSLVDGRNSAGLWYIGLYYDDPGP